MRAFFTKKNPTYTEKSFLYKPATTSIGVKGGFMFRLLDNGRRPNRVLALSLSPSHASVCIFYMHYTHI